MGPAPAPAEVDPVVEVGGEDEVVDTAAVLDVVEFFGWVVPEVEPVPDEPHAAKSSAPARTPPAKPRQRYDTRTPLASLQNGG